MATPNYVDLAYTWLNYQSNVGVLYHLSNPFAMVTDQHKRQKKNIPGSTPVSNNIPILAYEGDNPPGDNSPPSQNNQTNQDASSSFANAGSKSNSVRAGFQTDIFSSNPMLTYRTHDSYIESLHIPIGLNTHENGLHWPLCMRVQRENEEFAKTQGPCYLWYSWSYKISLWYVLANFISDQHQNAKTPNKPERNLY